MGVSDGAATPATTTSTAPTPRASVSTTVSDPIIQTGDSVRPVYTTAANDVAGVTAAGIVKCLILARLRLPLVSSYSSLVEIIINYDKMTMIILIGDLVFFLRTLQDRKNTRYTQHPSLRNHDMRCWERRPIPHLLNHAGPARQAERICSVS
jgi:hypothetical protein